MATARPLLWGWRRSFRREIGFFGLLGKHVGTAHEASGQDTTLYKGSMSIPSSCGKGGGYWSISKEKGAGSALWLFRYG